MSIFHNLYRFFLLKKFYFRLSAYIPSKVFYFSIYLSRNFSFLVYLILQNKRNYYFPSLWELWYVDFPWFNLFLVFSYGSCWNYFWSSNWRMMTIVYRAFGQYLVFTFFWCYRWYEKMKSYSQLISLDRLSWYVHILVIYNPSSQV